MNKRMIFAAGLLVCLVSGCSSFRGLPSHGGGKRFDEEQRVVASAVRRAAGRMDLSELRGLRVRVILVSIPTSGAGNVNWGGLQSVGLSGKLGESITRVVKESAVGAGPETTVTTKDDSGLLGISASYRPNSGYQIQRVATEGDVAYLRAAIVMNAHHYGIEITESKVDAELFVLVDVLGTNRSRNDYLLWQKETLAASCEISYYARDLKRGNIHFRCRRSSAVASYNETRIFGLGNNYISRTIQNISPGQFDAPPKVVSDKDGVFFDEYESASSQVFDQSFQKEEGEYLELLSERARYNIASDDLTEAAINIERIEMIDSDYKDLQDLYFMLERKEIEAEDAIPTGFDSTF